jgi:hypothetical protein
LNEAIDSLARSFAESMIAGSAISKLNGLLSKGKAIIRAEDYFESSKPKRQAPFYRHLERNEKGSRRKYGVENKKGGNL